MAQTTIRLTYDDLEHLAFTYGGQIERNLSNETYRLVGAVIDGRTTDLGPVPGPHTLDMPRAGAVV